MKNRLMLKKILPLTTLMLIVQLAFSQNPLSTYKGPEGIYVVCPNALPKGFSYLISRQQVGTTNWEPKATLTFEQDSTLFFSKVQKYSQASQAFPFPSSPVLRKHIWDAVLKANDVQELGMYGGMTTILQSTGNVWYDNTAKSGMSYMYELKIIGSGQAKSTLRSTIIKFETKEELSNFKLTTFQAQPFEKKITLYYKIGTNNEVANILVFKRIYLQSKFEQINAKIGVVRDSKSEPVFLVTDSAVNQKMVYEYFAVPIDKWGNIGQFSDTIRVGNMITDETPVFKSIRTSSLDKENAIKVAWKFAQTPYIKSVDIYRSTDYNGKDYRLLGSVSGKDSIFIDKDVAPVVSYYYTLVINGAYGKSSPSARISGMLKANRPTVAPQGLKANVNGKLIELEWQKTDPLTYGYYVFRKEGEGNFKQIGSLRLSNKEITTMTDTIQNLTSSIISYSVKTFNTSYQISHLSDSVQIANPSKTVVEEITNFKAKYREGKIMLYWDISQLSQTAEGFNIYRKENKGASVQLNKELITPIQNYYEDLNLKSGNTYSYQIEVVGINNAVSEKSSEASVEIVKSAILSPGSVSVRLQKNYHVIMWNSTDQKNIKGYTIYRTTDRQKPEKIGFVKQSQTLFADNSISASKSYHYGVVCQDNDGTESSVNEWVGLSK